MSYLLNPRESNSSVASTGRSGGRHQIKRSLTELAAPVKLSRHHRKDRHYDEKGTPQSAAATPMSLQQQAMYNRASLDMPRSEGMTPMKSPDQSRRASLMLQREEEARGLYGLDQPESRANTEERLRQERERASLRVE